MCFYIVGILIITCNDHGVITVVKKNMFTDRGLSQRHASHFVLIVYNTRVQNITGVLVFSLCIRTYKTING